MKFNRVSGLLLGFLLSLVTVVIAASGVGLVSPAPVIGTSSGTLAAETHTLATAALTSSSAAIVQPQSTSPRTAAVLSVTPETPSAPSRPGSLSPSPTAVTPAPATEPAASTVTEWIIGYSVEQRPIMAYRIGDGSVKVALVADIHGEYESNTYILAQQLWEYYQANPEQVPPYVSLWILPTVNPDGMANGTRWNANDVDLNRNADTDLDGCAGNDWSPDTFGLEGKHRGAGGAYPFSEPESRALRDFLDDAWVAVFYHSAAEAIFVDRCKQHTPTAHLAEVLSAATGYPVPEEGWAGYPVTGDFGDYLAGEGVAAVILELTDHENPEFERNREGVQALLASLSQIVAAEATQLGADFHWIDESNTGSWRFAQNAFLHPISLEVLGGTAYMLDGGRVLAINLDQPAAPDVILAPGDEVEGVRVLEPLDLAAGPSGLLALDRAGDVYRYVPEESAWSLERKGRPVGDTYDHYYVALAAGQSANYLLETSHEQLWRFSDGQVGEAWTELPQSRDVDIAANSSGVYVLTRSMNSPLGSLVRYGEAQEVAGFKPNLDLMHPRQIAATDSALYTLDRAGRRLLALDPDTGALQALYQFPDRRGVSAVWADPASQRLILASRDTLFFFGEPQRSAIVDAGSVLSGPQPHDLDLLQGLRGLSVPIEGARITKRDFQLPGAPRHYRLGVHEGIDFYGNSVGVTVNRRTPVLAVADGIVVRAMVDYQPLTAAQATAWETRSRTLGYTPPDVLDGYRGMQIWVDHGEGLVSRYAHLGRIEPGIVEGVTVKQGQILASVGNSGTPGSVSSETFDVHLHLELWLGDHFVGQFLRPIEAREWLERILR